MKRLFLIPFLIIISCDETTNDEVSLLGTWNITSLKYYSNPDCTGAYEELSGTITFNESSAFEELVIEYSFQDYCQEVGGSYDGTNCIVGDGSLFFDGNDYVEVPHNEILNISDRNGNEGTLMAYIKIADASEVTYNRICLLYTSDAADE